METPKTIYLHEYEPPAYHVEHIDLTFELDMVETTVTSVMQVKKNQSENVPLQLDGEMLDLVSIELNGVLLHPTQFEVSQSALLLHNLPALFELRIVVRIHPNQNSELEGLYESGNILCTQNEPEGFRRITYFIDRPDNMSHFTTRLIGDKAQFPVLLSNGNLIESGELEGGMHYALWDDPFPKPSYLYAVVAGDLGVVEGSFVTMSGREVALKVYCDPGNESKSEYALDALKKSMKWDEKRFGREYDLDIYMIVAVDSFNMGAMENKGLNIFNSHYVLADAQTATDENFLAIEGVIGHEYFHNWTGNRITCRDWFQLTLKEGLTVFRDQEFSADMNSRVVQRISDVATLRSRQFVEDASPNAHPIQPQSYIEINNFYTPTVYEKGAEVIRMLHTLLGEADFRRGMDLYFKRHDGQAVTTDDFIAAHEDANRVKLEQFKRWYTQVGTPLLRVASHYDAASEQLLLDVEQVRSPKEGVLAEEPLLIPLAMGLLDTKGVEMPLRLKPSGVNQSELHRGIVLVTRLKEQFVFEGVREKPVVSLNRNFAAPVKLEYEQSLEERTFIMAHDADAFNRYEVMQQLSLRFMNSMLDAYEADDMMQLDEGYIEAFGHLLNDDSIDALLKAKMLHLPGDELFFGSRTIINAEGAYRVRRFMKEALVARYEEAFSTLYEATKTEGDYTLTSEAIGKRALHNLALTYLVYLPQERGYSTALEQFNSAQNMTERFGALALLASASETYSQAPLQRFYSDYRDNMLVMTKYLAAIASAHSEGVLERVKALHSDPVYDAKVPNLVRALVGSFSRNYRHFHAADGSGYAYVADQVLEIDAINPQIASGIARAFKELGRMKEPNRAAMQKELERIMAHESLSKNVYEIVEQILEANA